MPDLVASIRRSVMADIDTAADNALAELDRHGASVLAFPPATAGGEWDWYADLSRSERARLARKWMSIDGAGPDLIADAFHRDVDSAMAEWLRLTRTVDAADSMHTRKSRHGYVPSAKSLGSCGIDQLFPDSGYSLGELFAPRPSCVDYLARFDAAVTDEGEWREEMNPWPTSDLSSTPLAILELF